MSNLYKLTQNLHKIIQEKSKKCGVQVEIKNDFYISKNSAEPFHWCMKRYLTTDDLLVIQAQQIRQILLTLKDVLGYNPEYIDTKETTIKHIESANPNWHIIGQLQGRADFIKRTKAQSLCHWLDGLEPLFDREPETVLEELTQILQSI